MARTRLSVSRFTSLKAGDGALDRVVGRHQCFAREWDTAHPREP